MASLTSPRYDLDSCIEVARAVSENGGEVSAHTLAAVLGYKSVENGAFLSRVGASKQFGLLEGSSSALRVTTRAMTILHPAFPENAVRARFEAFVSVPLFGAVFDVMEGRPLPPTKTGLRNMLRTQFGVGETQASLAAARLLDSADQAGLFSVAGPGKLLKPRLSPSSATESDAVPAPVTPTAEPPLIPAGSYPKLIEGALEQLPPVGSWDEQGLQGWLQLFQLALRVVYKLPASPETPKSEGPAPGSKPATPQ